MTRALREGDPHSQVCSAVSPAVPGQCSSPPAHRCKVHPKRYFLGSLGEEGLEALLWKSVPFTIPPWPSRACRQLPGCKAPLVFFSLHITFPFQPWAMAKQSPPVPHHDRRCCHVPQPHASSSPCQPGLGQEETLCVRPEGFPAL